MWTAVAPMSLSRDAVGVCLLGDRLYAVGGYDGQVYLNTVEAYDPQTNEWTQVNTYFPSAWLSCNICTFTLFVNLLLPSCRTYKLQLRFLLRFDSASFLQAMFVYGAVCSLCKCKASIILTGAQLFSASQRLLLPRAIATAWFLLGFISRYVFRRHFLRPHVESSYCFVCRKTSLGMCVGNSVCLRTSVCEEEREQ